MLQSETLIEPNQFENLLSTVLMVSAGNNSHQSSFFSFSFLVGDDNIELTLGQSCLVNRKVRTRIL